MNIYRILNLYNNVSTLPREQQQEYYHEILLSALENDNYLPLAIAKILNIKLPYLSVKEELAKAMRDNKVNVSNFIYDNNIIYFTPVLARWAARFNNLDFFQNVIERIREPLDLEELREIALRYDSFNIVAYINSLLDE